jgi:hypothetical protein
VRGQRDLEPAAERGAVDRDDHGLDRILDALADFRKRRRLCGLAELADVRAGNEITAGADDEHDGDGVVGLRRADRLEQTVPYVRAEGVDRRVVDRDDENVVAACRRDGGCG